MKNGWTGGQYSLFRACLGLYLFLHFIFLLPWTKEVFSNQGILPAGELSPWFSLFPNLFSLCDNPLMIGAVVTVGALLSLLLLIGYCDRLAAIGIWYILACLAGRNPLILNPSLPYIGWLLIAHCLLPPSPYGSWKGRGRLTSWSFPSPIFLVAWIVLAVSYSYSGYTKLVSPSWLDGTAIEKVLHNPLSRPTFLKEWLLAFPHMLKWFTWGALGLELLFAPLCLFRFLRPWMWLAMVGMHLGLIALIDFAELSVGMLVVHFFTFNPAWIPSKDSGKRVLVFYDGICPLCTRFVHFLLAEDRSKTLFFAPLDGPLFPQTVKKTDLPDSLVVYKPNKEILIRSEGVLYLLSHLGGLWRLLAALLSLFPRSFRDTLYDKVAQHRRSLSSTSCPSMPLELRQRFLSE